MRVRVLVRPALAPGFELAGLAVARERDGIAAAETLKRFAADPEVGMVFVDDGLYRELPRDLLSRLDRRALPMIVPIPTPLWDERGEAEAYILEILRQAIGYRVRPR